MLNYQVQFKLISGLFNKEKKPKKSKMDLLKEEMAKAEEDKVKEEETPEEQDQKHSKKKGKKSKMDLLKEAMTKTEDEDTEEQEQKLDLKPPPKPGATAMHNEEDEEEEENRDAMGNSDGEETPADEQKGLRLYFTPSNVCLPSFIRNFVENLFWALVD